MVFQIILNFLKPVNFLSQFYNVLDEEFVLGLDMLPLPFYCSLELAKLVFSALRDFFVGIFEPGIHFARVSLVKTQLYSL